MNPDQIFMSKGSPSKICHLVQRKLGIFSARCHAAVPLAQCVDFLWLEAEEVPFEKGNTFQDWGRLGYIYFYILSVTQSDANHEICVHSMTGPSGRGSKDSLKLDVERFCEMLKYLGAWKFRGHGTFHYELLLVEILGTHLKGSTKKLNSVLEIHRCKDAKRMCLVP